MKSAKSIVYLFEPVAFGAVFVVAMYVAWQWCIVPFALQSEIRNAASAVCAKHKDECWSTDDTLHFDPASARLERHLVIRFRKQVRNSRREQIRREIATAVKGVADTMPTWKRDAVAPALNPEVKNG